MVGFSQTGNINWFDASQQVKSDALYGASSIQEAPTGGYIVDGRLYQHGKNYGTAPSWMLNYGQPSGGGGGGGGGYDDDDDNNGPNLPALPELPQFDPYAGLNMPEDHWLANMIPDLYQQAASGVGGATNPYAENAYGYFAGAANPANIQGSAAGLPLPRGLGPAVNGIDTYMNPYTNSVIDMAAKDINRQLDVNLNDIQGDVAARSAFGARGDLMKNEARRNAMDTLARTSAGLRNTGWQNALSASQADLNRLLEGTNSALQREYMGRTDDLDRMLRQALGNQDAGIRAGTGISSLGNSLFSQDMQRAGGLAGLSNQGFDIYNSMQDQLNNSAQQIRDTEQQTFDNAMQQWNSQMMWPFLAYGMQLPNIQGSSTQTTSDTPGLMDILGQFAQGFAQGYGGATG